MDSFDYKGSIYLLIIDYYSRYIEIAKLSKTAVGEVMNHCKSIFARHGIPEMVASDNGPQFAAGSFEKLAQGYNFDHVTSRPYYPQSNGEAERAVKTTKDLLKKEGDSYLSLLTYTVFSPNADHVRIYFPRDVIMAGK
uniref:Integrase catalytic domain-containing protein n=1 Tax=Amphimedon queenslandica TaxID=400682 RepID=A0A1X7VW62_AMPQE